MILAVESNELPASVWMLAFMFVVALILLPIMPLIHRRRLRKERAKLRAKLRAAKANMNADGKRTRPPGPYVPHEPWRVGTEARTPRSGPPRANAYHGGPWPRNK